MRKVVFHDWAEEWLKYKKKYVKESTYANYLILMRNHIIPAMKERNVNEINSAVIQEQISVWMECGRMDGCGGLSQKTIRDMVTILKMSLYDYAKLHEEDMPVFEIEYPSDRAAKRLSVLSREQQECLLNIVKKDGGYESLGYAMSLYTGIRIGELCALQWKDIDMQKRSIVVDKTLQRIYLKGNRSGKGKTKITITTPKSAKSARIIPISRALYELLDSRYCRDGDRYILTGTRKYIEPRLYRKHYQKFLIENKTEYIHFHSLRHTFATRCVECGANYKVVSELLGHSSVNITLNLYVHPQWEEKMRCVEMI